MMTSNHHVGRTRLFGALLAILLAGVASLGHTTSARADYISYYCVVLVAPYSACPHTSHMGSIYYNRAFYNGRGTVGVCEKSTENGVLLTRNCGNNDVYSYVWSGPNGLGWAGNNSQWWHTISGYAHIFGSPPAARAAGANDSQQLGETNGGPQPPAIALADSPAAARAEISALRGSSKSSVTTIVKRGETVRLTSTKDALCLEASRTDSGTCQGYEKIANGDMLAASICAPNLPTDRIGLYGVVPDGVTAVEAIMTDGVSAGTATVTANTFRLDVAKTDATRLGELRWHGRAGTQTFEEVIPDDLSC